MIFIWIVGIAAYFIVPAWIVMELIYRYDLKADLGIATAITVLIEFAFFCQMVYWMEEC